MGSVLETVSQRSAYMTQALATMGVDPEWDKRLTAYLTTECLMFSDVEFGVMADANELWSRTKVQLQLRFGENFSQNAGAKARLDEVRRETDAVNEVWAEKYCKPHWTAANDLLHTPAPTLAAALFKSNMIFMEDLYCEPDTRSQAMVVLAGDFHRLGLKEAV
jgi:hypothetical protein